ncbi:MAG: Nramp family divalent metal transporter, partial [Actinomycetota bacterium]|nr:Nramp family divalent metal transporter [Actinomycetota bacterium]
RWNGWWRLANIEQLIVFLGIGLVLLISLSVLVNSTIGTQEDVGTELGFIQDEARALGNIIGRWFQFFFLAAVAIMLFSTNVGIVDYTSRLTADALKTGYLAESRFWSESKLYLAVVWIMTIGGSTVLIAGLNAPIVLLIISSAGVGSLWRSTR